MSAAATLKSFRQALLADLEDHVPQGNVILEERRGIILTDRVELNRDTFVAVYSNALSNKTSYAVIWQNRRLAGYYNYKVCHYHPPGEPNCHVACAEPTAKEAIAKLVEVCQSRD